MRQRFELDTGQQRKRPFAFAADARVEFFDVFGKPAGTASVAMGLVCLDIPASGFAKVIW